MDEELKERMAAIASHLKEDFGAQALILCGSRSVGDYKVHSDWDLKAFVENPAKIVEENQYPSVEGEDIDCTFHSVHANFSWDEFGTKLRFCEIVFDDTGAAKRVLEQAQQEYTKGPEPWTTQYASLRVEKVKRYENKIADCIAEKNWSELHQRLCWHFLENTYTWWYGVRGEWEPRPQTMFDDIRRRDPKFHEYMTLIVHIDTSNVERARLLHELHEYFFASKEFRTILEAED